MAKSRSRKRPDIQGQLRGNRDTKLARMLDCIDWDSFHCNPYIRSAPTDYVKEDRVLRVYSTLYNPSLVVCNPNEKTSDAINLPGITNSGKANFAKYHLNGTDHGVRTGYVYVVAGAATAYPGFQIGNYLNASYTGSSRLVRYNTSNSSVAASINLVNAASEFRRATGKSTNNFQNMAEDLQGISYVINTFGKSVAEVPTASSEARLWCHPQGYAKT
ncbi:MAG: hypothetical protein M1820_006060 [Bogoriella megaspora]|nr:MAG: hypothetical protein M1820_006060 [Bogoriella megaspora]